jgi:hypothetical protein
LKRKKTGAEKRELVTLLDEPFLAFSFNYLSSPHSAPAVGAMSVVVAVAYIAAVVGTSPVHGEERCSSSCNADSRGI